MTFEQVREAALNRTAEFNSRYPGTREGAYRRIAVMQQLLFARAARENTEYAGQCAHGPIQAGFADLADMEPPVTTPESITLVVIHDEGESDYAVGTRVTIVTAEDQDGIAPRATLRNRSIAGVAGELDDVEEIMVYYPYRPEGHDPAETGTRVVELREPYTELLVVDLARELIRKDLEVALESRAAIIALFDAETESWLGEFTAHVRGYAPIENRFVQ